MAEPVDFDLVGPEDPASTRAGKLAAGEWRAHSERENLPPIRDVPEDVELLSLDQVEVKTYVGGLVKSFERKAA